MTPKEYADVKLSIMTLFVTTSGLTPELAEKWFQWVITLPNTYVVHIDHANPPPPTINWQEAAPHLRTPSGELSRLNETP